MRRLTICLRFGMVCMPSAYRLVQFTRNIWGTGKCGMIRKPFPWLFQASYFQS